jgi:PAS domain S-box-containing protein
MNSFFQKINKTQHKKLKKNLDNLLREVEVVKGDFSLDRIFDLAEKNLTSLNISTMFLVLDDSKKNLIIRYLSAQDKEGSKKFIQNNIIHKKIPYLKSKGYRSAIDFKKAVFCSSSSKNLIYFIENLKFIFKKNKFNSIVLPVVIRGEAIGVLEFLGPDLKEEELSVFEKFLEVFVRNISNTILFQAVKASEKKYRKLVDNANDMVVALDNRAYFTFANKMFYKMSGYSSEELKDLHFLKLVQYNYYNEFLKTFNNCIRGKIPHIDSNVIMVSKTNQEFFVSISGVPIIENGKIIGAQAIIRDISETEKLQERLRKSKDHYEKIMDAIHDSICVIDQDFIIKKFNKAFADKVGFKPQNLSGENYKKIIARYDDNKFTDFGCEHCGNKCFIESVFKNGKALEVVKESISEDGSLFFHKINVFPKKNEKGDVFELVIIFRDITARKRAEFENKKLSEFNQRILDNAPVSILVLDKNGKIILANNLAKRLMERKEENLVEKSIFEDRGVKKNKDFFNKYKDLLDKGEKFYFENLAYTAKENNQKKYLNIIAVPLYDNKKKLEGAISMGLDNTEAKQTKLKLEELNYNLEKKVLDRTKELNLANKKLSEAIDLKSKFISDASHELRTPLTVIQGNLDLAAKEAENNGENISENFEPIFSEVERMVKVLSDLTILTNVDSSSESVRSEKLNLGNLFATVVHSLGILAHQKKIILDYDRKSENIIVYGDEAKLEKLLLNMVRNAIKYTEEMGSIHLFAKKLKNEIKIYIKDTGIGIPEEDLPFIFERFYRVDKARSRGEGGTGLGLSICKWIVEAHGGQINVESKVGEGTTFIISLPVGD